MKTRLFITLLHTTREYDYSNGTAHFAAATLS
jgi:hypothetical protein